MNDLVQHQEGEGSDEPFRLWKGDEEDELADLVQHQEGEDSDEPFRLEKGDEVDELALMKGPQHMPASKAPPSTHAHSYNPPPRVGASAWTTWRGGCAT